MNIWEEKIRAQEAAGGYTVEDKMLADYMTWVRNTYPQLRKAIFHIENEGNTSGKAGAIQGAISLAKGKLKGVFDILCVYRGIMIWFEFKTKSGVWSKEQKELAEIWNQWGIEIHEIKDNFDLFKHVIENRVLALL